METVLDVVVKAWELLRESAVYVIFGLVVAGLLKVFLPADLVSRHLGRGRFTSVIKAALLGIPIPLCSCGVLPAAASLKRQGANNGATTAFLISTPETGVDSIALTYALIDPIMTIARPTAAFVAASVAGVAENLIARPGDDVDIVPDIRCPVDGCCDGVGCAPASHRRHHSFGEKVGAALKYAFRTVWGDLAGWFLAGIVIAGVITAFIPEDVFSRYLGGGLPSMLLMLAVGIPLYICASASTPIAAALILKGVSPGAALVFLLVGPATNVTSLTVLAGVLGKRASLIYLGAIATTAVLSGLVLDQVYRGLSINPSATLGSAAEWVPPWLQIGGSILLLLLSVPYLRRAVIPLRPDRQHASECGCSEAHVEEEGEEHGSSACCGSTRGS